MSKQEVELQAVVECQGCSWVGKLINTEDKYNRKARVKLWHCPQCQSTELHYTSKEPLIPEQTDREAVEEIIIKCQDDEAKYQLNFPTHIIKVKPHNYTDQILALFEMKALSDEAIINIAGISRYYIGVSEREGFINCVRHILDKAISKATVGNKGE